MPADHLSSQADASSKRRLPACHNCCTPPLPLALAPPPGDLFLIDPSGVQLQQRQVSTGATVATWELPPGGCSSMAFSDGGLLAAVCGPAQQVYLLSQGQGGALERVPALLACSVTFADQGYLWVAERQVGERQAGCQRLAQLRTCS